MFPRRSARRLAWILCLVAAVFQAACQSVGSLTEQPPEIDVVAVEATNEVVAVDRQPVSYSVDWQKVGETTVQVVQAITYIALYVAVTSLDVYYARSPGNWQNTPHRR
jgi:hypothetical protein